MSVLIKQSTTTYPIALLMVDSTDHITGKTGINTSTGFTVVVYKGNGTTAAGGGTFAEIGNGIYHYTPSAGDVGTLGETIFHVTASGADPADAHRQVIAFDPYSANVSLDLNQLVPDDATDSTKLGHLLTLLRALADNSMAIASGVLRLKARDGTTNVGRTLTITGTVPSDTTRTAS